MKKRNIQLLAVVATGVIMSSCAAFRGGGHERCPAYGNNIDQPDQQELNYAQKSQAETIQNYTVRTQE